MEHLIKLVHNASRLVLPTNQSTVSAPRDTNQPIRAQYVCEKKHFIKLVRNASRHVQRSGEENPNIFIWIYSPQPLADLQGVLQFHNVVSSSAWIFFLWAVKLAEEFCSLGFSHLCLNSIFTSYKSSFWTKQYFFPFLNMQPDETNAMVPPSESFTRTTRASVPIL